MAYGTIPLYQINHSIILMLQRVVYVHAKP